MSSFAYLPTLPNNSCYFPSKRKTRLSTAAQTPRRLSQIPDQLKTALPAGFVETFAEVKAQSQFMYYLHTNTGQDNDTENFRRFYRSSHSHGIKSSCVVIKVYLKQEEMISKLTLG